MRTLHFTLGTDSGDMAVEVEYDKTPFVEIWRISKINNVDVNEWYDGVVYNELHTRVRNIIEEM